MIELELASLRKWGGGLLLAALVGLNVAPAAALEQQDLFVSGEGGYHTYRIPALIVSRRGTLLGFCEGRKHSASDSGEIDLLLRRSTDQGKTWTPLQIVWHDAGNTCGNPCPVVDETTGTILLLLTHNPATATEAEITARRSSATRTVWLSRSEDDGQSWSKPVEITSSVKDPGWGWYATGPGIGIQLKNGPHQGRLIVPCDHSYPEGPPGTAPEGASHVIYSDDHGRHWACGGSLGPGLNECQAVEVTDEPGALLLNMRHSRRETLRAQARSADGGLTWTAPQNQQQLIEPRCQASILRYSWPSAEDASRILFSNPAGLRRTNLTVRVSYDEGRTWPVARALYGKAAAYSCLAVLPDRTVGCLYERGATNAYEKITLARFPLSWLEESK